ncbi:unnamed protein product [Allacma fusca]|uniref:Transporter n=1 Tax=Allacma fusca TaxID=39272 RepID=A0A8J2NKN4_9HEXA|nr:unnamed protein product [Allacma fusca]
MSRNKSEAQLSGMDQAMENGVVNPAFQNDTEDNLNVSMTSINLGSEYDHTINITKEPNLHNGLQEVSLNTKPSSENSAQSKQAWKEDNTKTGNDKTGDPERDQWDKPIEFLLSCISMSVGLGNIWRFPFTCYENGGGCFLIVYLIVLTLVGRPIYFLELVIGQFSSSGPIQVWKMVPVLKGVGYGQMIGATCVVSFYVSIMGLTVFFFFASLQSALPWSVCDETWAGECNENKTASITHPNTSLSQLYFGNEVLKQKGSIDDGIGMPEWRLTLCLLFSWMVIFLVLFKGVKSSGKSAYFTSLFPYVVIFILLIRGVTLEGAWTGITYFIVPQWDRLYDIKIWYAAVGQCFLSLGTGFGIITMLSSYNSFNRNIYKDAMIISAADTFTSMLAGVTIFAILGNLAHELNVDISEVVDAGPGLAFESLPYAIAQFSWVPQIFSLLFFFMLFTIGLGSACSLANAVVTVIADEFPSTKRWILVAGICVGGFLFGLIYVTPGGQFMVTLVDYYGVSFLLYVMAVLEVVGVAWFYGMDNICRDVEFMLNMKLSFYWIFCWKYLVPVALTAILVYSVITAGTLQHNGVDFPESALLSGRIMATVSLLLIPICAIHAICKRKEDTWGKKIIHSFSPASSWGPQDAGKKAEWERYKEKLN